MTNGLFFGNDCSIELSIKDSFVHLGKNSPTCERIRGRVLKTETELNRTEPELSEYWTKTIRHSPTVRVIDLLLAYAMTETRLFLLASKYLKNTNNKCELNLLILHNICEF